MLIFKKVTDLQGWLNSQRQASQAIGFAPTMGALHQGHLELIRMAKRRGNTVVASIFVNPTQFNDPKDLEKYPRMPEQDATLLLGAECDVLFIPTVEEVYPPGLDLTVRLDFGPLERVMEGIFRPGHFVGMATVVKRLLDIVQPHHLYMGQKDFQQLSIVRSMLQQVHSPIELVMCPTVREADGLAMSSRNVRLSPEMRAAAPVIYQSLLAARETFKTEAAGKIQTRALQQMTDAGLQPEYFELVDGFTLLPVTQHKDHSLVVACTAVFAGDVRLIDNLIIQENPDQAIR
ncbi:MAG: pantoate--beta-alanine ligase [Saprospiraceae bacterium]|nr:pantoate--beta-alanine ligase [Saprospiraceae bacterium]